MRWWAPEVKKRIDRKDAESPIFTDLVGAYQAVCESPKDGQAAKTCWDKMMKVTEIFDREPPGAFDYLVHIGEYIV
jgi:hypothetical protein